MIRRLLFGLLVASALTSAVFIYVTLIRWAGEYYWIVMVGAISLITAVIFDEEFISTVLER